MALPIPKRVWLVFVAVALVASACGGETAPTSAAANTTVAPGGSVGGTDSANDDATDGTDTTDSTTESGNDPAGASAGFITIGDQTWQFVPRQCSVYAPDTVSIWGVAESNPDVEVTFDILGAGEFNLEVDAFDTLWAAGSDDIVVTVDGQVVTGTATVSSVLSDESSAATFEFHCGQ